jgi:hypothetical protein
MSGQAKFNFLRWVLWLLCLALCRTPFAAQDHKITTQNDQCDQYLLKLAIKDEKYGYHWRVSRCEGKYPVEVSGGALLRIVSLTEYFENFGNTGSNTLQVVWPRYGTESVRLRAVSLKRQLYYRMDLPSAPTSYDWPLDLVKAVGLTSKEIGILGWTMGTVGTATTRREIYLPLHLQAGRVTPATKYEVVLLPGAALKDLFYSLSLVGNDGRVGQILVKNQSLRGSYYSAGQATRLTLPELKSKGIYFLEVGAILQDGRPATTTLWFYHKGR